MNPSGTIRIEALQKENYDTWKIQMEALLVKNDAWNYVNGTFVKPTLITGDVASDTAVKSWIVADNKAKSDIILSISPSELKQIKGCNTSRDVWLKLEEIFQSKGPARKATLLKQLMLQKMKDGDDVREHTRRFFDAVDKLHEMEIEINDDLLTIMLLYSLPASYENFRCAIESRDKLPTPETLRVKIAEESDARKSTNDNGTTQNAMVAAKWSNKKNHRKKNIGRKNGKSESEKDESKDNSFRFKCHKCREVGHKAADCKNKRQVANNMEDVTFFTLPETRACKTSLEKAHISDKAWCIDSGCSSHLCRDLNDFVEINSNEIGILNLASNAHTNTRAKGDVAFEANVDGTEVSIRLNDALYVPDLRTNLMSVGKITDNGFTVTFNAKTAEIMDKNGRVAVIADRVDGLYFIRRRRFPECKSINPGINTKNPCRKTLKEWHVTLGHLNLKDLREAARNGTIQGLDVVDINEDFDCETCLQYKMTRPPFPKESKRATEIGDIVHSDVCGPMRTQSNGKAQYFVTFIDDSSRWCEVSFIRNKNEVLKEFEGYRAAMEKQHGFKLKCLQSDNGKEYVNAAFNEALKKRGIQRRLTAAYNPEQNGIAERKNRSLVETARCLLAESGLPPSFWAEAVYTANYIRNRTPTSKLGGKTPFEARFGKPPDATKFKRFGEEVFCLYRSQGRGKFEPRARKGVFLGYPEESKAYRIWIPEEKRVEITRDVRFLKDQPSLSKVDLEESHSENLVLKEATDQSDDAEDGHTHLEVDLTQPGARNDEEQQDLDFPEDDPEEDPGVPEQAEPVSQGTGRGRGRPRKILTGKPGRPKKQYQAIPDPDGTANCTALLTEVPIKQAMSSTESHEWIQAMSTEVKSIIEKCTWDIVNRPNDRTVIGSRFVLRNKYDPSGNIKKRKARIVARGFSQQPGTDFHETFAPVARIKSIRLAVALAAHQRMHIRQLDITTAYLNGTLEEEVYMEAPNHLEEVLENISRERRGRSEVAEKARRMLNEISDGDKVCQMKKALYGLRQAGYVWHKRLDQELRSFGATPSNADPCVYLKGKKDDLTIIVIYVDDILILSKNEKNIDRFKDHLKKSFEVNDLGEPKHCLGMEFERKDDGIYIHQTGYVNDILRRFEMSDCNPVSTPMDVSEKLSKSNLWKEEDGKKPPYRELVGALLYLSVTTPRHCTRRQRT